MSREPAEKLRRGRTTFRARASRWVVGIALFTTCSVTEVLPALACSYPLQALDQSYPAWRDAVSIDFASAARPRCAHHAYDVAFAVSEVLAKGGIVLFGEVHDNARHHAMRGDVLRAIAAEALATKPAFVFEHIRADQIAALDPPPATTDALFAALKWDEGGWPDKAIFAPLFQQVLGRPIYAGEPERGRVRDVARQGLKAWPEAEVARLKLDVPLPDAAQDALLTELEASHCGLMPKTAFGTMAIAQRYRDAFLADAAMAAAARHGSAIVFTGNGHARRDRGAPFALKQRGFNKPVLVVLFTESAPDKVDPAIADIIVSSQPAPRKDPCEEMRARFGKKG